MRFSRQQGSADAAVATAAGPPPPDLAAERALEVQEQVQFYFLFFSYCMTEYHTTFIRFNNCIIIVVVVAVAQRAMKAERKLKAIQRELTTQRGEKVSDIALLSPRHAFVCFYRAVARRRSSPLSSPLFSLPVFSSLSPCSLSSSFAFFSPETPLTLPCLFSVR